MASNGTWAESVVKVMRGKLDELNKQVAAVQAAIASVENGFEVQPLNLPSMFQPPAEKDPDGIAATYTQLGEVRLTKLPNIEDTPTNERKAD